LKRTTRPEESERRRRLDRQNPERRRRPERLILRARYQRRRDENCRGGQQDQRGNKSITDDKVKQKLMSFTKDQKKYYRMRENNKKCPLVDDRIKALLDAKLSFEPVKNERTLTRSRSPSRSNATLGNNVLMLPKYNIYLLLLFTLIINTAISLSS